jgi:hypothetical protein
MPVARQLTALDIYDVLTDLVPGATVLFFVYLLFPVESTALTASNTMLVFAVLIGSLLIGHILQWLRSKVGRKPGEFQRNMKAVRDDPEEVNSIQRDFFEATNEHFDIDDELDDGERFRLVLSYLETRPSVRALRFQSVYSFHRSLVIASLVGVGLALFALSLHFIQVHTAVRSLTYVIPTGVSAAVLACVSRARRDKFEVVFVNYAIREFYAEQIDDRDQ